jgi:hypothetical protein
MLGVIALCVAFGLLALLVALSRWLAHRPWAAAGNLAVGIGLLAFAQWLWPPVLHLQAYERMPARASLVVAQVYCERSGPGGYRVTLTRLPAGRMQVLEMAGDEWRLDVRTLVWTGHAAQLGLPDGYRLDRLGGRYLQATAATPPTSYALSEEDEPGEDVWSQARIEGSPWARRIDARHAYSPWRALAAGARYDVALVRPADGADPVLEARPANEAAAKAMRYTESANVPAQE